MKTPRKTLVALAALSALAATAAAQAATSDHAHVNGTYTLHDTTASKPWLEPGNGWPASALAVDPPSTPAPATPAPPQQGRGLWAALAAQPAAGRGSGMPEPVPFLLLGLALMMVAGRTKDPVRGQRVEKSAD